MKKFIPILYLIIMMPFFASAIEYDNTFYHNSKGIAISKNKIDTVDKYRKVLFIKLRKNKGYKSFQPLKKLEAERYELFDKGASYISFVLGFSNNNIYDYMFEPLFTIETRYGRSLDLEMAGGYFVDKNVAIGGRLGYGLKDSRIIISSPLLDLAINSKEINLNSITTDFTAGFFVKNFIPLDDDKRIFVTNETQISYTYRHSLSRNEYEKGNNIRKSEIKRNQIGIGITPGLMYFLSSRLSLEFAISPVFVAYQNSKVLNNEIEKGVYKSGGFNYIITPLKMKFGISYFFGLDTSKKYKR